MISAISEHLSDVFYTQLIFLHVSGAHQSRKDKWTLERLVDIAHLHYKYVNYQSQSSCVVSVCCLAFHLLWSRLEMFLCFTLLRVLMAHCSPFIIHYSHSAVNLLCRLLMTHRPQSPSPPITHGSSSSSLSSLSSLLSSLARSVFHSDLKIWLFGKSFPPYTV